MTTQVSSELDGLFNQELASVNDDSRRRAALAAFQKLRPRRGTTVEEFLTTLGRHKDMWAAVSSLGILDFAGVIVGRRSPGADSDEAPERGPRTRLSEGQKNSLKSAALWVLEGHPEGMGRGEVATTLVAAGLAPPGLDRAQLPEKLRQPLQELCAEGKLHTVGQKRQMRYVFGARAGR